MRRARRRFLAQTIYGQASLAGSVAMGGFVLLLLVGSQALEWYWLAALVLVATAIGVWRTWKATPSPYRLAQTIDSRLGLHDTLSTAWYFGETSAGSPATRTAQFERALATAETVDLKAALPAPRPRSLYAVSGLAMLACGLVVVRYGVTQTLDLRPSLVRIALQKWLPEESAYTAAEKKSPMRKGIEEQLQKLGINIGNEERASSEQGPQTEALLDSPDSRTQASSEASKSQVAKADANDPFNQDNPGQEKTARGEAPGEQNGNDQQEADGEPNGGKPSNEQKAEKKGNQSGAQNPSNLMDKMRDAMASLMNKLKQQSRDGQSQQQSSQEAKDGNSKSNQKGAPAEGKPNGQQQAQQGDNNTQQGQGDKSQMAQGRGSDKSNQAPSDQKSGIGKEDGDKSAREAEQLAAMGKLSEIIGKRSKDLSGEIMIEVQSNGKQQLRTAYSGKQAAHAEAGREISRDEIPLEYQQYVQQYFEQVRKSDPGAATPKTRGSRGAGN